MTKLAPAPRHSESPRVGSPQEIARAWQRIRCQAHPIPTENIPELHEAGARLSLSLPVTLHVVGVRIIDPCAIEGNNGPDRHTANPRHLGNLFLRCVRIALLDAPEHISVVGHRVSAALFQRVGDH